MLDFSDPNVLNRIGIAANFFAAFLLAPELLGEHNIKKLDNVADKLAAQAESIGNIFVRIAGSHSNTRKRRLWELFYGAASAITLYLLIDRTSSKLLLGNILGLALVILFLKLSGNWRGANESSEATKSSLVWGALLLFSLVLGFTLSVTFYFSAWQAGPIGIVSSVVLMVLHRLGLIGVLPPAQLASKPKVFWDLTVILGNLVLAPFIGVQSVLVALILILSYVFYVGYRLMRMTQGRAKGIIIGIGVALFVAGTIVQFWATFLPPQS